MCGHGTIGVVATLAYLNRIGPGTHRIETPVGIVTARLGEDGAVEIANVPSYRMAADVTVNVPGFGPVTGDVAWGGNWFYLVKDHDFDLSLDNLEALTDFTWRVRESLAREGITGEGGHEIDHVELFGPSPIDGIDSKNFVLCPGKAYDRSPCGTGTSAKLGQVWRQESIVGSVFEGSVSIIDNAIHPHIKGSAFITAEAELILDVRDPFCMGIRG
jgi:4-hydroxyproline epimerase